MKKNDGQEFSMTKAFGIGRCSRCGAFARREELTQPDVFMGFHPSHKLGKRGGDRCKAIIRKRQWRRKWTTQRKACEKELRKFYEELGIMIPF